MFRLLMKLFVGAIQIPLTIGYFILNLLSGILAGTGWIVGVLVFMITGICWLFGQFDVWYQPLVNLVISLILIMCPSLICEKMGDCILSIKSMLSYKL